MLSNHWWKIPAPICIGVIAMWIPLSIAVMTGIFCGLIAYAGLKVVFDNFSVDETWDEVEEGLGDGCGFR